ncbi:MAG: hypothetical protein WD077_09945 [Bacteroidia bacterium]
MEAEGATPEQVNELEKILAKRISSALEGGEFTIRKAGQTIEVDIMQLRGMPDMVMLLQSRGETGIHEVYDNLEFFPVLEQVNEKMKPVPGELLAEASASAPAAAATSHGGAASHAGEALHLRPVLQYLRPCTSTDDAGAIKLKTGPVTGYVNIPDTADFYHFSKSEEVQFLLPENVHLALGSRPVNSGDAAFEVFAVKKYPDSNAAFNLTGMHVKEVAVKQRKRKPVELQIEFTPEGQRKMDELAQRNSGKNIGVLLDGKVISYPVIKQSSGNTSLSLTGHWTLSEASAMAALFPSEPLPLPVKIISLKKYQ